MKDQDRKIPQVEKVNTWLTFVERQWHIEGWQVQPCVYHFITIYPKPALNTKRIIVARIECDQPEPAWVPRECTKVMEMLREAIEKAVGKPTQKFLADIIEWSVKVT